MSSIRLLVASIVPEQSPSAPPFARIELVSVASPATLPVDPEFPATVEPTIVGATSSRIPPAAPPTLPVMVEFRTVTLLFASIAPPPPPGALFPESVDATTVRSP